jgi:hypothetical protein
MPCTSHWPHVQSGGADIARDVPHVLRLGVALVMCITWAHMQSLGRGGQCKEQCLQLGEALPIRLLWLYVHRR